MNVKDFGAKGDIRTVSDGHVDMTTPKSLNSVTANFTSSDVGKIISVASGGTKLKTRIEQVSNATQVVLQSGWPSKQSISNADVMWGTDDTGAVQSAINNGSPEVISRVSCKMSAFLYFV